jgi:hypothetical protein
MTCVVDISHSLQILAITLTSIYSIIKLRIEKGATIHTMWLGFSFVFVLTFVFAFVSDKYKLIDGKGVFSKEHAAIMMAVAEAMYDFISEGWIILGIFLIVCVVQILAYVLAGLSGSAGEVTIAPFFKFLFFVFLKSYIASGGFWIGLFCNGLFYGWFTLQDKSVLLLPILSYVLVASSFIMLYFYDKTLKDLHSILMYLVRLNMKLEPRLLRVHEWMTRFRKPEKISS